MRGFVAEGVGAVEATEVGDLQSGVEVVEVEPVHCVELLAAELEGLVVGNLPGIGECQTVGVVVAYLLGAPPHVGYDTHTPRMVAQEVVPSGHTRLTEGSVAPVKHHPFHRPVLVDDRSGVIERVTA